jgi:hypothetical protein
MFPSLSAVFHWLQANESLAIWLEGVALVAIFGLELAEYKRQGQERKEQHDESAAQMKIARDAADAARTSADAVLNSERAWVTVKPYHWSPELRATWQPGDDPVPSGEMPAEVPLFSAQLCNSGKTPAQIDEVAVRYLYVKQSLSVLPEVPEHGIFSPQNGYLLVPNDNDFVVQVRLRHFDDPEQCLLKRAEIDALRGSGDRRNFLYAFGLVRYRDAYGKKRETGFGYVYDFPRPHEMGADKPVFRRDGPSTKYNKAT